MDSIIDENILFTLFLLFPLTNIAIKHNIIDKYILYLFINGKDKNQNLSLPRFNYLFCATSFPIV
jgi:hypothetical protein